MLDAFDVITLALLFGLAALYVRGCQALKGERA
jgi:hypothetical protein